MKLQSLRYFISVVELKSFTKASKKFFVSQPALSKSIKQLEDEFDCALIDKYNKKIALTEKGKIVYEAAKKIIKEVDDLVIHLNEFNNELKVKLGYVIYGHLKYFNNNVNLQKNLHLSTVYDNTTSIKEKLLNNNIDIALLPKSKDEILEGVMFHTLAISRLHILVPNDHPFYKKDFLLFKELRKMKIIAWDSEENVCISKAQEHAFIKGGIRPIIAARVKKLGDMVIAMKQHNALGLCLPFSSYLLESEYRTIPVLDSEEEFALCLAWKKDNNSESLSKLLECL